jgi:hypothetical protein
MSSNANDSEVFIYTGNGGERVPDDVVRVRVDPSVTSIPVCAFYERKKLTEVEMCEGVVEIGLLKSASLHHSGGLEIGPSVILFNVPFVSTMALKALEKAHLLTASSQTLESRPSSP